MSDNDEKKPTENGGVANHENVITRQDKARDKIRVAVQAQQEALAAQQRAVQSTSDAFIAEQELASQERQAPAQDTAAAKKAESRRTFIKVSAGLVAGAAIASVIQIPMYDNLVVTRNNDVHAVQGELTTADAEIVSLQSEVTSLQTQVASDTAFLTLSISEQAEVEAIVEAIIPSDSSGVGAKETGVAYFIDRQLKDEYGTDGSVYMDGPWIPANSTESVTVNGVTYPGTTSTFTVAGTTYTVAYPPTPDVRVGAGTRYQYAVNKRDFWRMGLAGIETYANAAYGGNFETLSASDQTSCLNDLWSNNPTTDQFNGILPSDFAYEVFFLTWSGFLMDPLYGGNRSMLGWVYTGFNGVNMGNAFGEGYTTQQLMVMSTPVALKPISLGMFQQGTSQSGSSSSSSGTSSSLTSSSTSGSSSSTGSASSTSSSSGSA